jgi:hypothetical protein
MPQVERQHDYSANQGFNSTRYSGRQGAEPPPKM